MAIRKRILDVRKRELGEDSALLYLAVQHDYSDINEDWQTATHVIDHGALHGHIGVWDHCRAKVGRFYKTMIQRSADAPEEVAIAYRMRLGSHTVKALLDTQKLPEGPEAIAIRNSQPSNVLKRKSAW